MIVLLRSNCSFAVPRIALQHASRVWKKIKHVISDLRGNGGTLFSPAVMAHISPSCAYAVCSHSLPHWHLSELLETAEDFKIVPAKQRVTPAWLEACVRSKKLPEQSRTAPLYAPLPHELPLPGFPRYVITCSTYEKPMLRELVELLGGASPLAPLYCADGGARKECTLTAVLAHILVTLPIMRLTLSPRPGQVLSRRR